MQGAEKIRTANSGLGVAQAEAQQGCPAPPQGPGAALSRGSQARDFPLFPVHFFCLVLLGGLLGLDLDFGSLIPSPVCAHALSMPFSSCLLGNTILGREEVQLMQEK